MKILIDTREQVPLEFTHEYVTGTIRRKLDVGDYSVEYKDGSVPSVVFERKSLGDLFGTMGKGYPRFRKELLRAQESDTKLILIVEATKAQVLRGYKHSRMKGLTVYRKLLTLWIKYGLVPMFCKDRAEMAHTICEYYGSLGRLKARGGIMAYFSNGSEGDMYESKYCDKCVHQGDENSGCIIWLIHLCYAYELCNSKEAGKKILDMLIPQDGLFAGKCSMFLKEVSG